MYRSCTIDHSLLQYSPRYVFNIIIGYTSEAFMFAIFVHVQLRKQAQNLQLNNVQVTRRQR